MDKEEINRRVNLRKRRTSEKTPSSHHESGTHHPGDPAPQPFLTTTGIYQQYGNYAGINTAAGSTSTGYQPGHLPQPDTGMTGHTPTMPAGPSSNNGPPWIPGYGQYNAWVPPFPNGHNAVS